MSENPGNYNPYFTVDFVAGVGVQAMLGDGSVRFVRTSINAARPQLFTFQLEMIVDGISSGGVDQLLRAEIVTSSGDRRAVANAILRRLGFPNPVDTLEFEMMVPAVQRLREASGISAIGALQLLSADPVSSPQDRNVLSGKECLVIFLGGRPN